MLSPTSQFCSRCGRDLRNVETRRLVTVTLTADFDGRLEIEGESDDATERNRRMWQEIERKPEPELEDEVTQKLSFTRCKPCRDEWVRRPFGDSPRREGPALNHLH